MTGAPDPATEASGTDRRPVVVSIVIVGLRRAPTLRRCIESIEAHVPPSIPHEVVVVLNEPDGELLAELHAATRPVRVLTFAVNLGFAAAVNAGAAASTGRYLALLNDDCRVAPGWLEELVATIEARPGCGAVGSTLRNDDGSLQEAGSVLWADGTTWAVGTSTSRGVEFARRVDYCSAASLLVRRDVWNRLGGMSEGYFPAYYEDVDLCLRAANLGWEVWYQPLSWAWHGLSQSTGALYREFLLRRNRAIFRAAFAAELAQRSAAHHVEHAMWLAMGSPTRVLVVGGASAADAGSCEPLPLVAIEELAADPTVHVTLHPTDRGAIEAPELARTGIRVVDDLAAHLEQPGVDYEFVVGGRLLDARTSATLRDRLPDARFVGDVAALTARPIGRTTDPEVDARPAPPKAPNAMATDRHPNDLPSGASHPPPPALGPSTSEVDPDPGPGPEVSALREQLVVARAFNDFLEARIAELDRSLEWLSDVVLSNFAELHTAVARLSTAVDALGTRPELGPVPLHEPSAIERRIGSDRPDPPDGRVSQ